MRQRSTGPKTGPSLNSNQVTRYAHGLFARRERLTPVVLGTFENPRCYAAVRRADERYDRCESGVAWFGFIANEAALLCQSHFDADAFTVPGQASPDWPKTTPARRSVVAQGTQFAAVLAAIRAGKHILHSGPTGSGKRDVWEQAMAEFDPTFGAETYPYVLFATMDMKLPDLVGKFEFSVEGQRAARVWVDGPLTLAMRAGRRLVVENFDQLPARLLTALVGAMDYGTIALFDSPPNDKEILEMVKARPGFAVDAFTRIPLLYGLSFSPEELAESIDPALLARFARKVDYPGR